MFYKTIKSQITSTKSQINLKYQYSMTKTSTTIGSYHCANPDWQAMLILDKSGDGSIACNFEFGSLEFV
jgi:hypothetical protein